MHTKTGSLVGRAHVVSVIVVVVVVVVIIMLVLLPGALLDCQR